MPTPSEQREDEILSDLLIEAGLVTPDQVQSARAAKQQSPLLLGEILVQQQHLPL